MFHYYLQLTDETIELLWDFQDYLVLLYFYMKGTDIQRNEVTSPANQRDNLELPILTVFSPFLPLPPSQIVHHSSSVCPHGSIILLVSDSLDSDFCSLSSIIIISIPTSALVAISLIQRYQCLLIPSKVAFYCHDRPPVVTTILSSVIPTLSHPIYNLQELKVQK